MGLYKGTTRYANIITVGKGGESKLEDITINQNGIYKPSQDFDGISQVNAIVPNYWHNPSPYLDENGKFVKPDEWDDIESIKLQDTDQEVYYLFDNTKVLSWCSIKVTTSGSNSFCDYGRVKNGVFETLLTETKSSGSTYQKILTDDFPNEDYIVLRIRPTAGKNLTRVEVGGNYTYNGRALTANQQPLLMRYGNMPFAQIIQCNILSLVSDNLMNCGALTTLINLYGGCQWLVRHRHKNWNTTNVTTLSGVFSNCYCLTDCDQDFSGWISSGKCTSIANFMGSCYSIKGEIDVTGWVTDNVTAMNTMFYNCYGITKIKGIENWTLPKLVLGSSHYPFNNCYSLYQNEERKLDLTNWRVGETVTTTQNHSTTFGNCRNLKEIDISTWNMNYTNNISNMFTVCYMLEKVSLPDNIGSGGLLTTSSSMFNNCYSIKSIDLSKIDFSKMQTLNTMCNMCFQLEEIIPPTTTPVGTSDTNAFSSIGQYSMIRTLDLSWLDASKFTNATAQVNDIVKQTFYLKELYPPTNISKAFTVNTSPNLSRESLLRIVDNLLNVSVATTLSLGPVNLSKLTVEEVALITGKGWTVA